MSKQEVWGNVELPGLSDEELLSKNWNKVAAGKDRAEILVNDPAWKQAQKQGSIDRSNTPWKQSQEQGIKRRNKENIKWQQNHANNNTKLFSKEIVTPAGSFPTRKAAVVWYLENTDISNVAKKIDAWLKEPDSGFYYVNGKIADKKNGQAIMTPYGEFRSIALAAAYLKTQGIGNAINKLPNWLNIPGSGYYKL